MTSDDLAASAISTRHELYHLLESEIMTDEERVIVDDWYSRTVESAGPFARTYGFLRAEFLPTLGELVQGAGGENGRRWLDANHPEGARWLRSFGYAP